MTNPEYVNQTDLLIRSFKLAREFFYDSSTEFALAPYGHIETRKNIPGTLAVYHELLREHLPNLANEVNAFGHWIGQLEAWEKVFQSLGLNDRITVSIELVNSIALSAAQTPYALRFRLIFAASHITHQANKTIDPYWGESRLPSDKSINFKVMRRCVERWKAGPALVRSLSSLSDEEYSEATGNFRNLYNHSSPPRLLHGVSGFVSRERDAQSGATRYGFGGSPPLELASLAPALSAQHGHALAAFHALSDIVKEQLSALYQT